MLPLLSCGRNGNSKLKGKSEQNKIKKWNEIQGTNRQDERKIERQEYRKMKRHFHSNSSFANFGLSQIIYEELQKKSFRSILTNSWQMGKKSGREGLLPSRPPKIKFHVSCYFRTLLPSLQ